MHSFVRYDSVMRFRVLLSVVLSAAYFAAPLAAHAGIPFFGPIIPLDSNICPASWGMLITVINNIISLLITLAIVFVAPLTIAWAGFLITTNAGNMSNLDKGKTILWNTVKGIVLALSGYLIVSAIMAVLYHPDPNTNWTTNWANIISGNSNDMCLNQAGSTPGAGLNQISGVSANGVNYLAPVSGNCSTSALISYGIDPAIANTMSCIAQNESSCNLTAGNPNSSAFGLFQIVNGWNDTGHNLNFPVCTQAAQTAGYTVNGNLNCSNAVLSGGAPNPSQITLYNACRAASANPNCNAQAAQWLYSNRNGYTNWAVASKCGV